MANLRRALNRDMEPGDGGGALGDSQLNSGGPADYMISGDKSGEGNRDSMGPRELFGGGSGQAPTSSAGPADVAPRRPSMPSPVGGAPASPQQPPMGGSPSGVMPFAPMAGPSGSMFGKMGGLKGGGLGLPFDPQSDAQSDPISKLMMMLKGGGGGRGLF